MSNSKKGLKGLVSVKKKYLTTQKRPEWPHSIYYRLDSITYELFPFKAIFIRTSIYIVPSYKNS